MTYRTVTLSTFDAYLREEDDAEERSVQERNRAQRLSAFPFSVMLQVALPEVDYANRWCWQQFGPAHGECLQHQSEYRVCDLETPHCHIGKWQCHWYVKVDYDFGFNEWYFAYAHHRDLFLANLEAINWGENYPK